MNTFKLICENCGEEMNVPMTEFVDVSEDPKYKAAILDGSFFMVKCPACGDETLVEYPVMYMDPEKKLTIYLAPEHEPGLVDQLNSLEIPDEEVDEEAVFRVVSFSSQLLEKIMIFDNGRDDRVMELYKAVVTESIREDWPDVTPVDLIYYANDGEEYLIIWDESTAPGDEKLTVLLDDGLYKRLEDDYGYALRIPAGKYAEVDSLWLAERAEI